MSKSSKIKQLRVSIVIPVYNEEDSLDACLQAIKQQTVRPFEVIVVDNNSTDSTVLIAQKYKFVRVLHEKRQGVVYARNRAFNAARGDIIGRIDADSQLSRDWVASVQQVFADNVDCVSGLMRYNNLSFASAANAVDLYLRRYMARRLDDEVAMQGANMAIRKKTWRQIRGHVCERGGLHEDFALGIHTLEAGGSLRFDERMIASIGYRQSGGGYQQFFKYVWLSPVTYRQHKLDSYKRMYPVVYLALVSYVVIELARRSYDPDTRGFSWSRLLFGDNARTRVNPATFVD